ncbi:hypothetical protein MKY07_05385 [Solibacillus sp. FSL W7-1472]|uniref:hypothetical protein n=1 Tax=Solibacillus sp. FSL W7-1472 TaxID=2921707 RepID=UPI0030DA9A6B
MYSFFVLGAIIDLGILLEQWSGLLEQWSGLLDNNNSLLEKIGALLEKRTRKFE